jgi:hypothetical protein
MKMLEEMRERIEDEETMDETALSRLQCTVECH